MKRVEELSDPVFLDETVFRTFVLSPDVPGSVSASVDVLTDEPEIVTHQPDETTWVIGQIRYRELRLDFEEPYRYIDGSYRNVGYLPVRSATLLIPSSKKVAAIFTRDDTAKSLLSQIR